MIFMMSIDVISSFIYKLFVYVHSRLTFYEFITILLTILGFVSAVYQFCFQMEKNRQEHADSNQRNWFISVIVLPYINEINRFYSDLISNMETDFSTIKDSDNRGLLLLAEKQAERKEEINAFFDHFQSLIKSFDVDLYDKISDVVLQLEDDVTTILSDYFFQTCEISSNTLRREILKNKKDVISILYNWKGKPQSS